MTKVFNTFSSGAEGWSVDRTEQLALDQNGFLGRFASGDTPSKKFQIDGSTDVLIEFDFLRIDSWDREKFEVVINGTAVDLGIFGGAERSDTSGTADGIQWTMEALEFGALHGVSRWNDQVFKVKMIVDASILPRDGTLDIAFRSNLNSGITDEAFGIDRFSLTQDIGLVQSFDDFESDLGSWALASRNVLDDGSHVGRVSGNVGNDIFGSGRVFTVTSGQDLRLEFDFLEMDSWDGETFSVNVNGRQVDLGNFRLSQHDAENSGFVEGITWSRKSDGKVDLGGQDYWMDERHKVVLDIDKSVLNGSDKLTVVFFNTLDQGPSDEWAAVDNVRLTQTLNDVNHFDSFGGSANSGWSTDRYSAGTDGDRFLGQFGAGEGVSKTFAAAGDGDLMLSFTFKELDSWDGANRNVNLISNGNFEDIRDGTGPNTTPVGWTSAGLGHAVALGGNGRSEGYGYQLGGWSNVGGQTLSQTIATQVGKSYQLEFQAGGAYRSYEGYFEVELNGLVVDRVSSEDLGDTLKDYRYNFVADGSTSELKFRFAGDGAGDIDIDNVGIYTTESLIIDVDGTKFDLGAFYHRNDEGDRTGITSNDIEWTMSSEAIGQQGFNTSWQDQDHHVVVKIPRSAINGDDVTVAFSSTANSPARDESFGIDNVALNTDPHSVSTRSSFLSFETEIGLDLRSAVASSGGFNFDAGPGSFLNVDDIADLTGHTNYYNRFLNPPDGADRITGTDSDGKVLAAASQNFNGAASIIKQDISVQPGAPARVEIELYEIDTWDPGTDTITLFVGKDGLTSSTAIHLGAFGMSLDEGTRSGIARFDGRGDYAEAPVSWQMTSGGIGDVQFGQAGAPDQVHRIVLDLPEYYTTDGEILVSVQSGANQDANDERLGLGSITTYKAPTDVGLLFNEDFENSLNGQFTGGTRAEGGPTGDYLRGQLFRQKFLTVENADYTIEFDFLEIDSWDNENLFVYVGSEKINLGSFGHSINEGATSGSGDGYSWTKAAGSTPFQLAGSSQNWLDQVHRYTLNLEAGRDEIFLTIDADLNGGISDESMGIDNFVMGPSVFLNPGPIGESIPYVTGFDNGLSDGWSPSRTDTIVYPGSTVNQRSVLGSFGRNENVANTFNKTEDGGIVIDFDFLELDSWDVGENFIMEIGNRTIDFGSFRWNDLGQLDDDRTIRTGYDGEIDSNARDDKKIFWRKDVTEQANDFYGNPGWTDQKHDISVFIPDEALPNGDFNVRFSSTLNESIGNEAWAIDNFEIRYANSEDLQDYFIRSSVETTQISSALSALSFTGLSATEITAFNNDLGGLLDNLAGEIAALEGEFAGRSLAKLSNSQLKNLADQTTNTMNGWVGSFEQTEESYWESLGPELDPPVDTTTLTNIAVGIIGIMIGGIPAAAKFGGLAAGTLANQTREDIIGIATGNIASLLSFGATVATADQVNKTSNIPGFDVDQIDLSNSSLGNLGSSLFTDYVRELVRAVSDRADAGASGFRQTLEDLDLATARGLDAYFDFSKNIALGNALNGIKATPNSGKLSALNDARQLADDLGFTTFVGGGVTGSFVDFRPLRNDNDFIEDLDIAGVEDIRVTVGNDGARLIYDIDFM